MVLELNHQVIHKDLQGTMEKLRHQKLCLAGAGVDGVKVDVQATSGMLGGPAKAAEYHSALENSALTHFPGNHVINCMCHSTENIYRLNCFLLLVS